jgi:DMSO reductase anchor subunit
MSEHAGHGSLVVFTSLAIAGAGLVSASAYFELRYGLAGALAMASGAGLLAAGLAVSLGHLGRKSRARLALRGAGRSALSNEALLGGLALAAAALAAGLGWLGTPPPGATGTAGAINAAFLLSIGLVYRIGGQRAWQGFSAITPLTAGLAFGAIAVHAIAAPGPVSVASLVLIAIDAVVFIGRWRDTAGIPISRAMRENTWHVRRTPLLAARFVLFDVLPFSLIMASQARLACVAAAVGLFVDRFGFYALALQDTTEREIDAVEARIASLAPPSQD